MSSDCGRFLDLLPIFGHDIFHGVPFDQSGIVDQLVPEAGILAPFGFRELGVELSDQETGVDRLCFHLRPVIA